MIHVDHSSQIPGDWAAAFAVAEEQGGGWDCYETWGEVPDALRTAPLAVRQTTVEQQIKALRDFLWENGGYKVNVDGVDYWFHSDSSSKNQQLGLVLTANQVSAAGGDLSAQFSPPEHLWKTMTGAYVPMTGNLALAIFSAAREQTGAIFVAAETHIANMRAAAVPEDYDFSGGWPETFPG